MKACFPVAQDRGLESRVYPHFGSAPMFLIVETKTKGIRVIANPACEHEHGRCHPLDVLADEKVDLVVVSGIGAGALDRLRAARIRAYHTDRATAGEALDAIARGALPPVLPDDVSAREAGPGTSRRHGHCHGHREGAAHGTHRCGGGRGR